MLNRATLIGNLGKDPELRYTGNGYPVCNFTMATSSVWNDRESGEKRERTEWHTVAIFNEHLVTVAEKYLRKGSKVYVEGRLETRKWQDQSGNDRYSTEVVLRPFRSELVLLGEKQGEGARDDDQRDQPDAAPAGDAGYTDEEIPF